MPRDELADALWGDAPPPTWDKALTGLVSKLRALLADVDGASVLTNAFGCYRLDLPEGPWVDVTVAANAVSSAEESLAAGRPGAGERRCRTALPQRDQRVEVRGTRAADLPEVVERPFCLLRRHGSPTPAPG